MANSRVSNSALKAASKSIDLAVLTGLEQRKEILRVFDLQRKNRRAMANTDAKARISKLKKLHKSILDNKQALQHAMEQDFKKHPTEVDLTEIFPSTSEIKHIISNVAEWMLPQKVDTPLPMLGTESKIHFEARGTCLIISPWNYPINLTFIPLASAIAAGNTAIIKPSEYTPHTSRVMAEMLKALFPESEVALFEGDHTVSSELLNLKFDHIFFTGSPAIGKVVMKAAAEHLTSVTLELGGKSPVIVDETANISDAARKIVWGKLLNKGQTCVAPDYLLVHESKKEELLDELEQHVKKLYSDAGDIQDSASYCRIVNKRHHHRIAGLLQDAVDKGATIRFGGELDEADCFIAPTVLTEVNSDMKIMEEEIFGPLLPVLSYTDLESVVDIINDGEKPLAMYVFSKRNSNVDFLLKNTSSGGVTVNDVILHFANPNLPFGGVNNSGMGQCHGIYGFKAFSHQRSVLKQKTKLAANQLMYPPYTDAVATRAKLTIKFF
ncbi:MAG: aldehyde dehydrogenase (NAD+) [Limisphaerales bacterium]|jgi:aldehyde dehydrogenase (NAD+)